MPSDVRTIALDWPPDALEAADLAIRYAAKEQHLSENAWALVVKQSGHVFSHAVAGAKAAGLEVDYASDPHTGEVTVTRVSRLIWPRPTSP